MADSQKPVVTSKTPYVKEMEPGVYFWCACGHSKNQPFCDGSHEGTGITPIAHEIEAKSKVAWCGCRASKKGCLCDGAHKKL